MKLCSCSNVTPTTVTLIASQYRLLQVDIVEIYYSASYKFDGTQRFFGVELSLPVPVAPSLSWCMGADVANDLARVLVAGSTMFVYPHTGYNAASHVLDPSIAVGQWQVDNYSAGRGFLVTGTYRTA